MPYPADQMNLSYPYISHKLQKAPCGSLAFASDGRIHSSHRRLVHAKRNQKNLLFNGYSLSQADRGLMTLYQAGTVKRYHNPKGITRKQTFEGVVTRRIGQSYPCSNGESMTDGSGRCFFRGRQRTNRGYIRRDNILNLALDNPRQRKDNGFRNSRDQTDRRPERIKRSVRLSRNQVAELC